MGDGFEVRCVDLTDLAAQLDKRAGVLAGQVDDFAAGATGRVETFDAFGVLGACRGAAGQYHSLAARTEQALRHAGDVLRADATTLRTTASTYRRADAVSADAFEQIGEQQQTTCEDQA